MRFWSAIVAVAGALIASVAGAVEVNVPGAKGDAAAKNVTFAKDVAPIVFQNCVACHRPGEVAPFALLDYKSVKKHAEDIVRVTEEKLMPPWKAEGHDLFVGERRLSEEQIKTIKAWVDAGSPEGNVAEMPKLPEFSDDWYLGKPDLVVKMPEAYTVPAEGRDVFRCFVIPLNLSEDKYVTAVEYRPSNRRVVHHALLFLDSMGQARKLDEADPGPGYGRMIGGIGFLPTGGLGGWAPGVTPLPLPDGIVRTIRKGSDLVIQTHFHPTGKPEVEQSSVALYFSKTPPKKVLIGSALRQFNIDIPAGEKNYQAHATMTVPVNVDLIGITPHAHLICKDMKVWATLADGTKKDLIWIKDWDFNWQDQYIYQKPIHLPAGTKIDMNFTYDNSSGNVRNPSNPPKRVRRGEQTTDEMAITFLNVVTSNTADANAMRQHLLGGAAGAEGGGRLRDFFQRLGNRGNGEGAK